MISTLPPGEFKLVPDNTEGNGLGTKNVMAAISKCAPVINPFEAPVIVDFKASAGFSTHRIGECPSLTKTRAGNFGYWCTSKGGPLTAEEMIQVQGFKLTDLPFREAGLSATAISSAIGNGQTLPLVMDLLPHIIFHANLVTVEDFRTVKQCMV